MRSWVVGLSALGFLLFSLDPVNGDILVVSPNSDANIEGNNDNSFPFNPAAFGKSSERCQQVYAASDFSALGRPSLLKEIDFRPDFRTGSAFTSTLPDIQIDLSTTSKGPDALNIVFASNVGADDTVVHGRGPLSLSSSDTGPANGPKDFDIRIILQTPFLYDPSKGNLLLDVRNFGGGATTPFDAEFTVGDSVSRVFTFNSGVGSVQGDGTDTLGLVTQFRFGPSAVIPEPAGVTLLGLGIGAVLVYNRRARRGWAAW